MRAPTFGAVSAVGVTAAAAVGDGAARVADVDSVGSTRVVGDGDGPVAEGVPPQATARTRASTR
jgi:hypothetical protein